MFLAAPQRPHHLPFKPTQARHLLLRQHLPRLHPRNHRFDLPPTLLQPQCEFLGRHRPRDSWFMEPLLVSQPAVSWATAHSQSRHMSNVIGKSALPSFRIIPLEENCARVATAGTDLTLDLFLFARYGQPWLLALPFGERAL